MTNAHSDIARLTAELADLQARYPRTTAQTGLVLMKRIVKIKRKLIRMGAARERVANITSPATTVSSSPSGSPSSTTPMTSIRCGWSRRSSV